MQHNLSSIIRFSVGLMLIMIGIVAISFPLVWGFILFIVAIPFISPHHGKEFATWFKEKFTHLKK